MSTRRLTVERRERSNIRCAYCHGPTSRDVWRCTACDTALHRECWALSKRCPTLGCHDRAVRASRARRPRLSRWAALAAPLIPLVVAVAFTSWRDSERDRFERWARSMVIGGFAQLPRPEPPAAPPARPPAERADRPRAMTFFENEARPAYEAWTGLRAEKGDTAACTAAARRRALAKLQEARRLFLTQGETLSYRARERIDARLPGMLREVVSAEWENVTHGRFPDSPVGTSCLGPIDLAFPAGVLAFVVVPVATSVLGPIDLTRHPVIPELEIRLGDGRAAVLSKLGISPADPDWARACLEWGLALGFTGGRLTEVGFHFNTEGHARFEGRRYEARAFGLIGADATPSQLVNTLGQPDTWLPARSWVDVPDGLVYGRDAYRVEIAFHDPSYGKLAFVFVSLSRP